MPTVCVFCSGKPDVPDRHIDDTVGTVGRRRPLRDPAARYDTDEEA
jgi:hypothetical protein